MAGEVLAFAGMAAAAVGGLVLGRQCGNADLRVERDEARDQRDQAYAMRDQAAVQRDDAFAELQTDRLTGLANRSGFEAYVEWLQVAGATYTLGFLDLDEFKAVNDQCGHDAGDDLLIVMGQRLAAGVGEFGFAARLQGDEFVVVLPPMTVEQMIAFAWRIREELAELGALPGHFLHMQWASIGLTSADAREGLGAVLKRADVAMYRAKTMQAGIAVFDPALDVVVPRETSRPLVRPRDLRRIVTDPFGEVAA